MRNKFLILTEGATASHWISSSLSTNKDIFCSHGYTFPPKVYKDGYSYKEEAENRKKYRSRITNLSISEYFKELEENIDKKNIGAIHLFNYSNINSEKDQALIKKIKIVSIVRDPITRIQSFYEHFVFQAPRDNLLKKDLYDWVEKNISLNDIQNFLKQNFPKIDLKDSKNIYFIAALGITNSASGNLSESLKQNIKCFKYEDITSEIKIQQKFLNCIFTDTEHNAKDLFLKKKTNAHRKVSLNGLSCYKSWENWKKISFNYLFNGYFNMYQSNFNYQIPRTSIKDTFKNFFYIK